MLKHSFSMIQKRVQVKVQVLQCRR